MSPVTDTHVEKETLSVEVNIPGHESRVTTPLFHQSRLELIEREGGRCFICGDTEKEAGAPLEAHHHPVERSFATGWNWERFQKDCEAGIWGVHAKAFDWSKFDPRDPYTFVDDMNYNGLLLCPKHHRLKDTGIHDLPLPIILFEKYAIEGYQFNSVEIIHYQET